jgi:hypothetical protein
VPSRSRGDGSSTSSLGPTTVVHPSGAQCEVKMGRDGIVRSGDGRAVYSGGGKSEQSDL